MKLGGNLHSPFFDGVVENVDDPRGWAVFKSVYLDNTQPKNKNPMQSVFLLKIYPG